MQDPNSTNNPRGGEVGVLKNDKGESVPFYTTRLAEAWNSNYMKNVRKAMLAGEQRKL